MPEAFEPNERLLCPSCHEERSVTVQRCPTSACHGYKPGMSGDRCEACGGTEAAHAAHLRPLNPSLTRRRPWDILQKRGPSP